MHFKYAMFPPQDEKNVFSGLLQKFKLSTSLLFACMNLLNNDFVGKI